MSELSLEVSLSVIVPMAPNESLHPILNQQLNSPLIEEVVFVFADQIDQAQADQLRSSLASTKVHCLAAPRGRARQQNEGAFYARSRLVCFVHADSYFEREPWKLLRDFWAERSRSMVSYFPLKFFDKETPLLILNEWGAWWRSEIAGMPFGDQAFCLRRSDFLRLGAFRKNLSYGEDHDLIWRARANGFGLHAFRDHILTSARKYSQSGWLKTTTDRLLKTYRQALPYWFKEKVIRGKQEKVAGAVVACFVKTPGISECKTRLAKSSSKKLALQVYEKLLDLTRFTLSKSVAKIDELEAIWMVAEKEGLHDPRWHSFRSLSQANGSLGERLSVAYDYLLDSHHKVLLIGADSPSLVSNDIKQALRLLERSDFVLQPSLDGGYVLFGGRKPISKKDWTSVRYSSAETFKDFQKVLLANGSLETLEMRRDIDEIEDLLSYQDFIKTESINEASSLRREFLEFDINVAKPKKMTKIVTQNS